MCEDLENLLNVLNLAAYKLVPDGALQIMEKAPPWLEKFLPNLEGDLWELIRKNEFGFIESFLVEADAFWATNEMGSLKSGAWVERDKAGEEFLLEATAVTIKTGKFLIISRDHCIVKEKQSIIQKGRELALDYHALNRLKQCIQASRDKLEYRVKERTKELEMANQQLAEQLEARKKMENERALIINQLQNAQKIEAIGTLAGGIAHDFNNILSAIIGFSELSIAAPTTDAKLEHNLNQILNAATRAKNLVKQILTFSYQSQEEFQPVKYKPIIKEALQLLRASLPSNINIKEDLQSDQFIYADPTQLHQVVMNLCTNAGHAIGDAAGTLTISLSDRNIESESDPMLNQLKTGPYVLLTIKDTGCGMTPGVKDRIFTPFFTTKDKGRGTGMGLSLVHGIVKSCKGNIMVHSNPGAGTEFQIYFPAFSLSTGNQIIHKHPLLNGDERILFVDDEPAVAELAIKRLNRLGYDVVALTDSVEALNLFTAYPNNFDLIITDLTMPKMSGKELSKHLLNIRPDIPIIMCSGYSDSIGKENATNLGIKAYLMKPIALDELSRMIRTILDQ